MAESTLLSSKAGDVSTNILRILNVAVAAAFVEGKRHNVWMLRLDDFPVVLRPAIEAQAVDVTSQDRLLTR